jgi:hypothetical protein
MFVNRTIRANEILAMKNPEIDVKIALVEAGFDLRRRFFQVKTSALEVETTYWQFSGPFLPPRDVLRATKSRTHGPKHAFRFAESLRRYCELTGYKVLPLPDPSTLH